MDEMQTTPPSSDNDAWATAIRAMAQHAVIAGLVRTHPDREALIRAVAPFAETHRAKLLASHATDAHLDLFDRAIGVLLGTHRRSDSTNPQG